MTRSRATDGPALDDLAVRSGILDGAIGWGEAEGDEPVLLHAVTLLLEPLRLGRRTVADPQLRLHSLRLPVSSWAQLEGASFELGNVVREIAADGEEHPVYDAYGSLRLGDAYHEVVPRLLSFGARAGRTLALHLQARVNATDAPPSFQPADVALDARVELGAVHVVGDTGADEYPAPDEAAELAERLLDLDAYEPPAVEGGHTVLYPRLPVSRPAYA